MMRSWFVIVAMVSSLGTGAATQGTDHVQKRMFCPNRVSAKIDLSKSIGSDPTFSESWSGAMVREAKFRGISRKDQVISCSYYGTGILDGRSAVYNYTAKRKILDCKAFGASPYIDCRLEP